MVKCVYCGEFEANEQIFNPNTGDEPMLWDVCSMCKEIIENQQKLTMGHFIASQPHGKEIGEKMIDESNKRLKEISYEADIPIINFEIKKE